MAIVCGKYIPEEVLGQIFIRSACTKSIVRCTLVCRSWYSVIKSSQFINTHLSRPNNTKHLLCKTILSNRAGRCYSLHSDSEPSGNCVTLVFPHGAENLWVHGCCSGVICYSEFQGKQRNICLWNPTVRKLKILPQFPKDIDHEDYVQATKFWYDTEKDDCVVVKITYTTAASSVYVYSLSSNSWKLIIDTCPDVRPDVLGLISPDVLGLIRKDDLVYAKGTLHWLARDVQMNCWKIVSLDMNNAKFRETAISTRLQDVLYLRKVDANSLVIFRRNGSRCVCTIKVYDQSLGLSYTDSDEGLNGDFLVVGFGNNGEAVLRLHKETQDVIVSYNFDAKQTTDFFLPWNDLFLSAEPFVETLVLLNQSDSPNMLLNQSDSPKKRIGKRVVRSLKTLFMKIFK